MYLYFDNTGTLKEIFTAKPSRQGGSDWNTIHSYWESTSGTITGVTIRYARPDVNPFDENAVSIEVAYNTFVNTGDGAKLPYDKEHDVKFFEYFKEYPFYNFVIPDAVLAVAGPVIATIFYTVSIDGVSTRVPMGKFTFQVEPNATQKVKYDDYISVSQWNYLVERLNAIESGFLQGNHTLDGNITYNGTVVFNGPTSVDDLTINNSLAGTYTSSSVVTWSSGKLTFTNLLEVDISNETILPTADNYTELGSSTKRFKKIWSRDVNSVYGYFNGIGALNPHSYLGTYTNPFSFLYVDMGSINDLAVGDLSIQRIIGTLYPDSDSAIIGGVNNWWGKIYVKDVFSQNINFSNELNVSNGKVKGNLLPSTTNTYDLGSGTYIWNNVYTRRVYADSATIFGINVNSLTASSVSVSGPSSFTSAATFSSDVKVGGYLSNLDGSKKVTVQEIRTMLDLLGTDSQSYIDTITEILEAFQNLPEGFNIAQAFSLKFDKANVLSSYTDVNATSNDYVYSSGVVKQYIDDLYSYFDGYGKANYAVGDKNGDDITTTYLKVANIGVSGGFVASISGTPVAQYVNVSGTPSAVSSVADMTDESKLYWLMSDGYVYYYDGANWTSSGQKFFDTNADLIPATDGFYNVGSSAKKWLRGYFNQLTVGNMIDVSDGVYFTGTVQFNGNITDGTYTFTVADIHELQERKADIDGSYDSMSVGLANNFNTDLTLENKTPYLFRASGGGLEIASQSKVNKIIGGTYAFNQLVHNGNFENVWNVGDGTTSVNNGIATLIATAQGGYISSAYNIPQIVGHVYLSVCQIKLTTGTTQVRMRSGAGEGDVYTVATTEWQTLTKVYTLQNPANARVYIVDRRESDWDAIQVTNVMLFDLTQFFGTTIANYIVNTGGVSWFRNLFPKLYYDYNIGSLESVKTTGKVNVGFNQWNEKFKNGYYSANGFVSSALYFASENPIPVMPNKTYYIKCPVIFDVYGGEDDTATNLTLLLNAGTNTTFTTGANTNFIYFSSSTNSYGTTYNHDICINISDATKNGTYEPHQEYEYPVQNVELRGIPQLDANNNLVYNGDEYNFDGTVTRKYAVVDLSTLTWSGNYYTDDLSSIIKIPSSNSVAVNIISSVGYNIKSSNTDSGIAGSNDLFVSSGGRLTIRSNNTPTGYIIYELATPTTESASPFTNLQVVNNLGTEKWIDNRSIAIPVGHETEYLPDLKSKLEVAPDSPDTDGYYVMKRESGVNTYSSLSSWLSSNGYVNEISANAIKENIGGALRHQLAQANSLDFNNTDYVDLGTFDWAYESSWGAGSDFYTTLNDCKGALNQSTEGNILCPIYQNVSRNTMYNDATNMIIAVLPESGGTVIIKVRNTTYNDATAFKNAMKGVLLAYEKA